MSKDEYGFDPDETYSNEDNPFWDGTPYAHPAWYRGNDDATRQISQIILKELGVEAPVSTHVGELWKLAIDGIRELKKSPGGK